MQHNTTYIFIFAAAVCAACSTMISVAAVGLRDLQDFNKELDRKKSVLLATNTIKASDSLSAEEIESRFAAIEQVVVDMETGEPTDMDPAEFDPDSVDVLKPEPNPAQVMEMPKYELVYKVKNEAGNLDMFVLPIQGMGLWGTLYGYLALDKDLETIRGITYYNHKETPGLGGEVDNPKWKSLWPGRKAFDEDGDVAIEVIKGQAGTVEEAPHKVDGLSGATITSRGVTNMLHFWLGETGFKPYLEAYNENRSA